jgi:hypothetical protein
LSGPEYGILEFDDVDKMRYIHRFVPSNYTQREALSLLCFL